MLSTPFLSLSSETCPIYLSEVNLPGFLAPNVSFPCNNCFPASHRVCCTTPTLPKRSRQPEPPVWLPRGESHNAFEEFARFFPSPQEAGEGVSTSRWSS